VFTARYELSPYIKQIRFVFKGLILFMKIDPMHSLKHAKPLIHSVDKVLIVTALLERTCLYFPEEITVLGYVALYFLEI
jgi:hypothetical protein